MKNKENLGHSIITNYSYVKILLPTYREINPKIRAITLKLHKLYKYKCFTYLHKSREISN